MSPSPVRRSPRAIRAAVAAAATAAGAVAPLAVAAPAHAETVTVPATGSFVVTARGNGHGHGMSQYGAWGAARKGKNYAQILGFYYPGTRLATMRKSVIRVRLSGFPRIVAVKAERNLTVTGRHGAALPYSGVSKYRLYPSGTGFALQQLRSARGSAWRTVVRGLPNRSEFYRNNGWSTRLFRADGSSTRFFGFVRATRSGASSFVVNRVGLDNYTAGVVSSEMPTSWSAQAVNAQAVAARTYGRYEVEHTERAAESDICDTTNCQVYGGRFQYDRAGHLVWSNYQPAAVATAGKVLQYRGGTIFAQFSASNGGYASSGGQPYLRAEKDPYDPMSGNPYINYTRRVTARSLASYFGLAKVTTLAITRRDGNGSWGGRVVSASLKGKTASGTARTVSLSGEDLQWALGLGTTLFTVKRG